MNDSDFTDPGAEDFLYLPQSKIDFSRMYTVFRSLALFDDLYLSMQGMNISLIDAFITEQEYLLLREYIELEKTPTDIAIFVSALSQIWKESGGLDTVISNLGKGHDNVAALLRSDHLTQMRDDPEFGPLLQSHYNLLDDVFQMAESIRITLAKHEIPGKSNLVPRAPGYGRINGICGALDFEVTNKDDSYTVVNRRDIADALRAVPL